MNKDYLDRLVGKAKGRLDDLWDAPATTYTPPKPTEKHSVRRDSFDKHSYAETVDRMPALQKQIETHESVHPTGPEAYEDLFNLLHQGDPRFVDVDKMLRDYLPQRALLEQMHGGADFKVIRKQTQYDEYNTALAMLTMKDRMDKAFDQVDTAIEAMNLAEDALAAAIEAAEEMLAGSGDGEPTDEEVAGAGEALAKAIGEHLEAEGKSQDAKDVAQRIIQKGLEEAQAEIQRQQEAASNYGIEPGTLKRMDFDQRRRLAERLNQAKMLQLSNLVGKFRMYADGERRRRIVHAPAEKFDVELGSDLSKIVASEFDSLAMPETEDLFWLRWAKGGLLNWKVRGTERAGKGPIIVVCDESGSMGCQLDTEGNTREAWSKAVALSLCDQARRDKRDFIYIGFSSPGEIYEKQFLGGIASSDEIVEFTEHFICGGTSYEGPIKRAAQIIRDYHEGQGKKMPDVVFLTDDACRVSDEFIAWWAQVREVTQARCYGLQIGGTPYANNLKDLTDRCMQIDQLNAHPQGVVELFREIG